MIRQRKASGLAIVLAWMVVGALSAGGAPGTERIPWMDYQQLLRWEVMGVGDEAPVEAYLVFATGDIGVEDVAELTTLGLDVVSVQGTAAVVRGPLTAVSAFKPESTGFDWVRSILPYVPLEHADAPSFFAIRTNDVLEGAGASRLCDRFDGSGVLVAVIDTGFSGALRDRLGTSRVHYVKVDHVDLGSSTASRLVEGREEGLHGAACAEAIAAAVPEAEFLLISAPGFTDRSAVMAAIAAGDEIRVDGKTIALSEIDVVSDSTFFPLPLDHNDGEGELAKLADAVVAGGVPFVYALGNFGRGEGTTRSFLGETYVDGDGDGAHDFDPKSSSAVDRNSLAITVDPWDGGEPFVLTIILEWDGWSYQVRENDAGPWTESDIVEIQDVDLFVHYLDPSTGSVVPLDVKSVRNQLITLYRSEYAPLEPLEVVQFEIDTPGTYLIEIRNATGEHPSSAVLERTVDFHLYVTSESASFDMEHHSQEGSLVNVGGAHSILSVGAVGWAETDSWCLMPFSSRGPTSDGRLKPELVAPNAYLSDAMGGPFAGTSAAAPVVAGLVALLRDAFPAASPAALRDALCRTAEALPGPCNRAGSPLTCPFGSGCNYGVGSGLANGWAAYAYLADRE